MKYVNLSLSILLIVAVAVLYFFHFEGQGSQSEQVKQDDTEIAIPEGIVYVNSDSLLENYEMYQDMLSNLESKRDKLEKEFQNRAQGLQTEFENFQRNQNNLTIGQARAAQEDLMKKEQNLRTYQQNLQQQLMQEENKMNNKLYTTVAEYLKRYGKKNNIQLVLTYSQNSPNVLYGNDTLDITKSVVSGLNQEYNSDTADAPGTLEDDSVNTN